MKTFLDCYPCFVDQALRAGRMATRNEETVKTLLEEIGRLFGRLSLDQSPPEIARMVYEVIRRVTGVDDPFEAVKKQSTSRALALYPSIRDRVAASADPLLAAVRAAAAGNVIDFGVSGRFDLEGAFDSAFDKDFGIFEFAEFKDRAAAAKNILYLGDNAGECVFDRLLIEVMNKPVTYAVRGRAVINDATVEDAEAAGIDQVARIVSSGTDAPGTVLRTCSTEFKALFSSSDLIISKGQGNYEALSEQARPLAFLLKAKCPVVAKALGCSLNDLVLQLKRP